MISEDTMTEMDRYLDANPEVVKNNMKNQQEIYASQLLDGGDDIINDLTHEYTWWECLKYRLGKVLG